MSHTRNLFISRASVLADVFALGIASLLAAKISGQVITGFSLRYMLTMRLSLGNLLGAFLLIGLWVLIFRAQGLYRPAAPGQGWWPRLKVWVVATGIGASAFAALGLLLGISIFTPLYFLIFWPTVLVLSVLGRRTMRALLGGLHLGDGNQRQVAIIGSNAQAMAYAKRLMLYPHSGIRLLGFFDDDLQQSPLPADYLGALTNFPAVLEREVIDEIVIAMPIHACSEGIQEVIDIAHERGIAVRFPMSQVFAGLTRNDVWRVRQEATLGPDGVSSSDLVVYSGYELGGRYLVKRIFDLLFASTLLIIASPVMLLATLAIYASAGRPAIFVQDRYGYNGRVFRLYKFRTMVNNADALQDALRAKNERDGAAFKMKNDPRVFPVGSFLRKTSIDELPQLFNVIKGEMSIVGPRPLPLADYRRMNNISHRRRLSVLPGITGPWQISGRDQISFEEWMQMDLDYIDDWRLSADLKILLLTVPVVLLAKGAK